MVGMLRYGAGLPFNRVEKLQDGLGISLPSSTQSDLARETAETLSPGHEELIRQGAQGNLVHNDDTTMRILKLTPEQRAAALGPEAGETRTGVEILRTMPGQSGALALRLTERGDRTPTAAVLIGSSIQRPSSEHLGSIITN
jgi:hypothetical protein